MVLGVTLKGLAAEVGLAFKDVVALYVLFLVEANVKLGWFHDFKVEAAREFIAVEGLDLRFAAIDTDYDRGAAGFGVTIVSSIEIY